MEQFIERMVGKFLQEQESLWPELDVLEIAKRKGFVCYTYAELAKMMNTAKWYIINNYDKDGFTFWSNKEHRFIICYNSECSENEVKWTIVHEMAHIVLGHLKTVSTLCRSADRKLKVHVLLEVEAQKFTKRFFEMAAKKHVETH